MLASYLQRYAEFNIILFAVLIFQLILSVRLLKESDSSALKYLIVLCVNSCLYSLMNYLCVVFRSSGPNNLPALLSIYFNTICPFLYMRLMRHYFSIEDKGLKLAENLYLLGIGISIFSILSQVFLGHNPLLTNDLNITENYLLVYIKAYGNPKPLLGGLILLGLVGMFLLIYRISYFLYKKREKDYFLITGVLITIFVNFNDMLLVAPELKWILPLAPISYLVEIVRIGYRLQKEKILQIYKLKEELETMETDLSRVYQVAEISFTAGSICHDIRNPLAIAKGSSEYIKMMLDKKDIDRDKILKRQEKLDRSLDRIEQISEDYMALMRNETVDDFKTQKVCDLVERAIELSASKIEKTGGVIIRSQIVPTYALECHENQIVLSLVNLISNSCDAILGFDEKWIQISCERIDRMLEIKVEDSGHGIPEDVVEHIFDNQFTTKTIGEGTGLGLNIVKRFIEAHAGKIYVDAAASHTTFIIVLPINPIMNRS